MDAPDGVWVAAEGNAKFIRTSEGWVHGAHVGAWRGLCVPGARDVTLEGLHGHRVIRAAEIASPRDWMWTRSYRHTFDARDALYVRIGDARRFGELAWSRTGFELRDRVHGMVSGFPAEEWERRRTQVIGLWAPELVQRDYRGCVAEAGLDERAAGRDARFAAGYRRALVHRGARGFGLSRRRLAAVMQVSRGRIDQILSETVSSGSVAAREAREAKSRDELSPRLELAATAHREAVERLRAARHVRAQRVVQARDEGLSLAQIAACLGVTRGRIQQLAAR